MPKKPFLLGLGDMIMGNVYAKCQTDKVVQGLAVTYDLTYFAHLCSFKFNLYKQGYTQNNILTSKKLDGHVDTFSSTTIFDHKASPKQLHFIYGHYHHC